MTRKRITFWAIATCLMFGCGTELDAQSSPPTVDRLTTTLITPDAAWSYYGSATIHTNGVASTSTRPPEIKALARALGRGGQLSIDDFAARTADYVRKNIRTEFLFGLGKGALGAVVDQSGTSFDKAQLMVEILREGGQSASYKLGTISLSATQFGQWTGLVANLNQTSQTFTVDARSACQMLADGGIPALVNGQSSCTGLTGNLTSVQMAHVWVVVNGKSYDPSFRQDVLLSGVDTASAMGCGTLQASTCGSRLQSAAMTGATTGTLYGAAYVQNVNYTSLKAQNLAFAQTVETYLKANSPYASVVDFVGGSEVDLAATVAAAPSLPYEQTTQAVWSGDIPDQFRTKFTVQMMGINGLLYADEIAGKRVLLTTIAPANSWQRTTSLTVERSQLLTANYNVGGPGVANIVTLAVDHPFAASSGSYADATKQLNAGADPRGQNYCYAVAGGTNCNYYQAFIALLLDAGAAGRSRQQHFSALAVDPKAIDQATTQANQTDGWATTLANLEGQVAQARQILEGMSKVRISTLHNMGLLHQGTDQATYFNIATAISANSSGGNNVDSGAAFEAYSTVIAALEGSVAQQNSDAYESASGAALFKLMNDKSIRFFDTNSSNLASVLAGSTQYSQMQTSTLQSYAAAGYGIILPQQGQVGSVPISPGTATLYMVPEILYSSNSMADLLNETHKGGGAIAGDPNPVQSAFDRTRLAGDSLRSTKYFGVNTGDGSFNLTPPADLVVGTGPGRLEFHRTYSSTPVATYPCSQVAKSISGYPAIAIECGDLNGLGNVQMGGAWKTNLNVSAELRSNGSAGLGIDNALQASNAFATIFGIFDLSRAASFQKRLAAIFAAHLLIDDFVRNSVSVEVGDKSYQFSRLPSGRYEEAGGSREAVLTMAGGPSAPFILTNSTRIDRSYANSSFTLVQSDGSQVVFHTDRGYSDDYGEHVEQAHYAADSVQRGDGVTLNYSYQDQIGSISERHRKYLIGVSSSVGTALTLPSSTGASTSVDRGFSQVSDGNGRAVSATCAPAAQYFVGSIALTSFEEVGCAPAVTDVIGGVTSYSYAPGNGEDTGANASDRVIEKVYLPSSSTSPFLSVTYDPLVHVADVTDGAGEVSHYYTGSVGGEEWHLGESQDGTGGIATTYFDKRSLPIESIDALGRVTNNTYDSAGRLIRTVRPEGNATEYSYDARGNRLSECQIAKGRVNWSSLTTLQAQTAQCNSGQGDLLTATTYVGGPAMLAADCPNAKTCNKIDHIVDPRGYRTNFTWSTTHGGLLSETSGLTSGGACAIGSICPTTTYGYTAYSGSDGVTFYLLTSKVEMIDLSRSRTTTYAYDAANHYSLKSSAISATGESATRTTCFTFDAIGNVVSSTEPLGVGPNCP